jgi:hypothetical protein
MNLQIVRALWLTAAQYQTRSSAATAVTFLVLCFKHCMRACVQSHCIPSHNTAVLTGPCSHVLVCGEHIHICVHLQAAQMNPKYASVVRLENFYFFKQTVGVRDVPVFEDYVIQVLANTIT